ncbi:hypothetical protein [Methanonatronarchaeum sp. AMET-Sl]|uniref:hypothetical protein n=1 Tax=Methanonatronarchaeum sp. AMET-Sl TaxID=3037654 RepID=UPI00244DD716|nr:hypothetical protein [Methanonatronarchaeum sp. AMET-Sl]WGI17949.1 hypothetical protein QEN48_02795 [Methanonatronarchaeum sp. AMET-Sl]
MPKKRDKKTGQYKKTYKTQQFIKAIKNTKNPTTKKIAKQVGCSYNTAYKKLNQLQKNQKITKQKIGNTLIWQTKTQNNTKK